MCNARNLLVFSCVDLVSLSPGFFKKKGKGKKNLKMSSALRVHIWRLREELNSSMAEQAKFICEIETLKAELAGLRQANEVLRAQVEEKEMYLNYWRRTAESLRRDLRSEVIFAQ